MSVKACMFPGCTSEATHEIPGGMACPPHTVEFQKLQGLMNEAMFHVERRGQFAEIRIRLPATPQMSEGAYSGQKAIIALTQFCRSILQGAQAASQDQARRGIFRRKKRPPEQ